MATLQFDGQEWDTLGERGNLLAGEGWRYTGPKGRVRHKMAGGCAPWSGWTLCGLGGYQWFGTGSQDEYERLASLPTCLSCVRIGGLQREQLTEEQRNQLASSKRD